MESESFPRIEEIARLFATAFGASRLYPAASTIPREAVIRCVSRSNEIASSGPLRLSVDPHGFHYGSASIGAGQGQVAALAEALHSLQVGQLVIAPGLDAREVEAFIRVADTDPAAIRAAGGARAALVAAQVRHIAVIEVSLRATDEEGLMALDLTTAPLDDIAAAMQEAVERRGSAAGDGAARDEVAEALGNLEGATREIALERMAGALMRLDEQTRKRVLALCLQSDTEGRRMDGMLDVIARMKPASLARLLRLVATQANADPRRIASALTLPPETARILSLLLTPRTNIEPDFGVTTAEQAESLAGVMAVEEDHTELDRQVSIASPALSAARALATAVSVSRHRPDDESVRAMADVLPQAARDGAFVTVREALRRLGELAGDPSLVDAVAAAHAGLADAAVLADVCRAPVTDSDAAIAGEILHSAGAPGSEALLDAYLLVPEPRRSLLRPILRGMGEGVLGAARSRLRTADSATAIGILKTLPHLGDKRAIPVIAQGLESLDEQVRFTALSALASIPAPEATAALIRGANHREPETQRYAVRELARTHAVAAIPALNRALEDINIFQRTYETRKEIIGALEHIGTVDAEKALRRFAQRTVGLGRKTRELRRRAIEVADELERTRGVSTP